MEFLTQINDAAYQVQPASYEGPWLACQLFSAFGTAFGVVTLIIAFWFLFRRKDAMPILLWIGGLLMSFLEVLYDVHGHLWWSSNLWGPWYTAHNQPIPVLIMMAYPGYICMMGYVTYRMLKKGLSFKGLWILFALNALSDIAFELPGTASGAYLYYGFSPFKLLGFPIWWSWNNSIGITCVGFVIWLAVPHLKGWYKAFYLILPAMALNLENAVIWPIYVALNMAIPYWAVYASTLFSFGLCAVVLKVIGNVACSDSKYKKQIVQEVQILQDNYNSQSST